MIEKKEVVLVFNGPLVGLTHSMITTLEHLQQQVIQPKLKVFIQTWNFPENLKWIKEFENKVRINSSRLDLDIVVEDYNSKEAYKALQTFQNGLGLSSKSVHYIVGKRLFYFYSLIKAIQRIEKYNTDAYVIRYLPDYKTEVDTFSTGIKHTNLLGKLIHLQYIDSRVILPPEFQGRSLMGMYGTNYSNTHLCGDAMFFTSLKVLKKIYSLEIPEFIDRLLSIYSDYKAKCDAPVTFDNQALLIDFLTNPYKLPNEGGVFIKKLIEKYAPDVPIIDVPIGSIYQPLGRVKNPWFTIKEDVVEEAIPGYVDYSTEHIVSKPKI